MLSKDQFIEKFNFVATKKSADFDAEQAILCIEIYNEGLLFLIYTNDKQIQYLKHVQVKIGHQKLNLSEAITNEVVLKLRFKKVFISYFDLSYTIVPTAFFDESKKEEFLKFSTIVGKNDLFLHDELPSLESKLIYSIDEEIKTKLTQFFPNHRLMCGISRIIYSFVSPKKNKPSALLHFRKNAFELLLHHKKIIFCSTFTIVTAEDVLYFLLSTVELNQFNPSEMDLIISGDIEKDSIWMKMINKYFPSIIYSAPKDFQPDQLPFELNKQHQFYQLLNLIHCE